MDKNYHLKESAKFQREGSCYIHTEMVDGKMPQTVLCGDMLAMLHGINAELNRIGELSNQGYNRTWELARMIKENGYRNTKELLYANGSETKEVKGSDWEEELRESIEKEVTKKANADNVYLLAKIEQLKKENISLNNQMVDVKRNSEKALKAKDKQIQELTKELKDLEHRFDKIWEMAKNND